MGSAVANPAQDPAAWSPAEDWAAAGQLFMSGRYDDALAAVERLHGQCRGQPVWQAKAALVGAKTGWNAKRPAEGQRWAAAAIDAAALAGDQGLGCEAWALKGACHAIDGDATMAVQCLDRSLRDLSATLPVGVRRTVLTAVGLSYQYLGLFDAAGVSLQRALELSRQVDSKEGSLRCAVNLAYAWVECLELAVDTLSAERSDMLARAAELIAEVDRLLPEGASDQAFYSAHDATAMLASACGDLDGACRRVQACLDRGTEHRASNVLPWWIELAYAHHLSGREAQAQEAAQRARALVADAGSVVQRPAFLRRLARLAAVEGQPGEVLQCMRRYHAHIVRSNQAMLAARAAELNALETTRSLHLELSELRDQRARLGEQFRALEAMARSDALTGLLNRRGLEAAHQARSSATQHLLLLDLDHFKRINDRFGHVVGDAVLRQIGRSLSESFRGADCAARFGGEEFVALLSDTSDEGASQAAERLRLHVERHDWAALHPQLSVTLSAGLAVVAAGEGLEAALARADAALYKAKSSGRNRVVIDLSVA